MVIAAILSAGKIGNTDTPYTLEPRYNTYYGTDMVIFAWDFYHGGSQDTRKQIEGDIHQIFAQKRLWTNHELFKLTGDEKESLLQMYREEITAYFENTEAKKAIYNWGVNQRRSTLHSSAFKDCPKPLGNIIFRSGCVDLLAQHEGFSEEPTVSDRALNVIDLTQTEVDILTKAQDECADDSSTSAREEKAGKESETPMEEDDEQMHMFDPDEKDYEVYNGVRIYDSGVMEEEVGSDDHVGDDNAVHGPTSETVGAVHVPDHVSDDNSKDFSDDLVDTDDEQQYLSQKKPTGLFTPGGSIGNTTVESIELGSVREPSTDVRMNDIIDMCHKSIDSNVKLSVSLFILYIYGFIMIDDVKCL